MDSETEVEWVSPTEYAAHYRISRRTVDRLIADGKLPATRIGYRILRIHRSELNK